MNGMTQQRWNWRLIISSFSTFTTPERETQNFFFFGYDDVLRSPAMQRTDLVSSR